ncbi:MAG: riboflavin synthase subunit alpha [Spirochaetes bacterium RIFOXYC1_FULL_54_7]|nr:MAG: riboflavin synthase subunit alpha [Spirochaetes bacterium RIFOXYC1_FULL_54_7]
MFTGIIEELGTVRSAQIRGKTARICINAKTVLDSTKIGDSIAVNGACQTVVAMDHDSFCMDALAETLKKTTLGSLHAGDQVHLERALTLSTRLGGHLVQGHINARASVRALRREGDNLYLAVAIPEGQERYLVAEGSVALDGVSLTICALRADEFEVNLVPQTCASTTLGARRPGDFVNLETDIIGKYVERLVSGGRPIPSRMERLLDSAF